MPLPSKHLTFDEALAIVRETMPDVTAIIVGNVIFSMKQRSKDHWKKRSTISTGIKMALGVSNITLHRNNTNEHTILHQNSTRPNEAIHQQYCINTRISKRIRTHILV